MAKEIAEQPSIVAELIKRYFEGASQEAMMDAQSIDFNNISRIVMVACGTAYLACAVAKYWFEKFAKIPVEIDVASEFRYRHPPIDKNTVALFVSQSGETADTLAALRYCKEHHAKTIGIINVETSSIARESDMTLPIYAGAEIGVASTKAFTCQLIVLLAFVLQLAHQKKTLAADEKQEIIDALQFIPALINQIFDKDAKIKEIAKSLEKSTSALFLGRGQIYPIALEGALKLKEISYIHAEGYASGELKHGPIALVDENMPVIVFAPKDALFEKTISNMQEVKARGGRIILFTDKKGAHIAGQDAWYCLEMPDSIEGLTPLLYAIPAQLLAYHTAVHKGTDVDQPRNLAKSVTVE